MSEWSVGVRWSLVHLSSYHNSTQFIHYTTLPNQHTTLHSYHNPAAYMDYTLYSLPQLHPIYTLHTVQFTHSSNQSIHYTTLLPQHSTQSIHYTLLYSAHTPQYTLCVHHKLASAVLA